MIKILSVALISTLLIGCNQNQSTEKKVALILDNWETEIPTSEEDIEQYDRPLPPEHADILVSSVVWPSLTAYEEIQILCQSTGQQPVIDALSEEFHINRYPRRNRALQLLEQIDDRDWGQHFYPTPSLDEWLTQEGLH